MIDHINYILLDAAKVEHQMEQAKYLNLDFDSLYRGSSEEDLEGVAPYLLKFNSNSNFSAWFFENGWGNSWGIFCKSNWPMHDLHKHFRKLLYVTLEDGEELYFRFYDPRVLRIFLPTCDANQIRELFAPINYIILEDEDQNFAIHYWQENGELQSRKIKKSDWEIPNYIPVQIPKPIDENIVIIAETPKPNAIEIEKPIEEKPIASAKPTEPTKEQLPQNNNINTTQPPTTNTKAPSPASQENAEKKSKWNLFE